MILLKENLGFEGWLGIAVVLGCGVMVLYFLWIYIIQPLFFKNKKAGANNNKKVNDKTKSP
jgi:hypothetical protein